MRKSATDGNQSAVKGPIKTVLLSGFETQTTDSEAALNVASWNLLAAPTHVPFSFHARSEHPEKMGTTHVNRKILQLDNAGCRGYVFERLQKREPT
ncbi:MAG: hypothetical protein AUH79_01190 [Betaproteobacteria bacterium 13_1_40CM_4_64_4]|nr:MAG: hypothetical protein AUH79_01190 [Betaproteobacteria bacterium 13_1_40CM_4_64_4]